MSLDEVTPAATITVIANILSSAHLLIRYSISLFCILLYHDSINMAVITRQQQRSSDNIMFA